MPSGPAWAWRVGLVAAWILAPTRARAASLPDDQTHALPCRPTIACTADLVDPGILELEVGYLHRRLSDDVNQESVPFLLKLTLARWVQVQVGGNGPTFAGGPVSIRYVDDVTGGFKFHLTDQAGWMPSTSVSAALSVPLAPAAGYLRTYDALLTVYVTKDFGWLHGDLNVGLNLWRLEGPLASQPWAALAVSVPLPASFGAMLETYLFADATPVSRKDAGILTAVSYSVRPWLVLDAGVDVGLVHSTRVWSAFAGVTVIPVRFWKGG
ncbi:MAG TPA: hypothetical protein VFN91_00390 [Myxococcaceae bacterium]|nr:hypothetical protein [Myxococcaceae bacterium]